MAETYGKLTIVAEAGRDPRGRRLVQCDCACGNAVVLRLDNVKGTRTKSCGQCSLLLTVPTATSSQPVAATPKPADMTATTAVSARTSIENSAEHGSLEWYRAGIASLMASICTLEQQARDLERVLAEDGVLPREFTSEDPAKKWALATITAEKMKKKKLRLESELKKLEASKALSADPHQSLLDRVARVRWKQNA